MSGSVLGLGDTVMQAVDTAPAVLVHTAWRWVRQTLHSGPGILL